MSTQADDINEKLYFVTLLNFDNKHHRFGAFQHTGMVLIEGDKINGKVTNLHAISAHGFYSHEMTGKKTWFEKLIGANAKLQNTYAVVETEEVHQIDLTGVSAEKLIQINASEKEQIEKDLKARKDGQESFFEEVDTKAEKDAKAYVIANSTGREPKDITPAEVDNYRFFPDQLPSIEEKTEELKLEYREKYYAEQLENEKKHFKMQMKMM